MIVWNNLIPGTMQSSEYPQWTHTSLHDSTDWVTYGVQAGCTATTKNEYGIPMSLICPSGII